MREGESKRNTSRPLESTLSAFSFLRSNLYVVHIDVYRKEKRTHRLWLLFYWCIKETEREKRKPISCNIHPRDSSLAYSGSQWPQNHQAWYRMCLYFFFCLRRSFFLPFSKGPSRSFLGSLWCADENVESWINDRSFSVSVCVFLLTISIK